MEKKKIHQQTEDKETQRHLPDFGVDIMAEEEARKKKAVKPRDDREIHYPVLPQRLNGKAQITIEAKDLGMCSVDMRYQRPKKDYWISSLADAFRRKSVPTPIHISSRKGWKNAEGGDYYWIVDGQQRWRAAAQAGVAIQAIIHETESLDDERLLFNVLNNVRNVEPQVYIMSHPSGVPDYIRSIDDDSGHSLYGRIQIGRSSKTRIAPRALISATLMAFGKANGGLEGMICLFQQLIDSNERDVTHFLADLGASFEGRPSTDAIVAFGRAVAKIERRRLTKNETSGIRRIRWQKIVAATAGERRTLMIRRIMTVFKKEVD